MYIYIADGEKSLSAFVFVLLFLASGRCGIILWFFSAENGIF